MNHARRSLTALALTAATGVLALAGCSGASQPETSRDTRPPATTISSTPATAATPPRPTADVDGAFEVDGARMHLVCHGSGARTVLLVAGFGSAGDAWAPVASEVAESARTCSYDRFGTGTSDAAPAPQTFETQATSLHELLHTAGEPGPYVVVGHSFGGLVAATYTSKYPTEVVGAVLLDASPTDWNATACAVPDLGTSATDTWTTTCAMQSGPGQNPESLDGPKAFAEAATIDDLGSVPLIVDQAADEGYETMGLPADIGTHLTEVWDFGQQRWADLSTNAQLERVPGTSHQIYLDQPGVIISQIRSLVDAR